MKLIIPACGEGTRLAPITKPNLPKLAVEIHGKPAILHIIEAAEVMFPQADIVVTVRRQHLWLQSLVPKDVSVCAYDPLEGEGPGATVSWTAQIVCDEGEDVVVWCCDTILEPVPMPTLYSWYAVKDVPDGREYCCVSTIPNRRFANKNRTGPSKALIGLYFFKGGLQFKDDEIHEMFDDRAISVDYPGEWHDTGTIEKYYDYQAKAPVITRDFNSVRIKDGLVYKRTPHAVEEGSWYHANPEPGIAPRLVRNTDSFIVMDYIPGRNLAHDYHNTENEYFKHWAANKLWQTVKRFHRHGIATSSQARFNARMYMYELKTVHRLRQAGMESLIEQTRERSRRVLAKLDKVQFTWIHGDPHTGNTLYCQTTGHMWLIDPRGNFTDAFPSGYGCPYYDLGKIYHDIYWGYGSVVYGTGSFMPMGLDVDADEHLLGVDIGWLLLAGALPHHHGEARWRLAQLLA